MESGFTVDQINRHFAKIEKHRKLVNDTEANDMNAQMTKNVPPRAQTMKKVLASYDDDE